LFITIYILPQICEKAQLLLDFFDKLEGGIAYAIPPFFVAYSDEFEI